MLKVTTKRKNKKDISNKMITSINNDPANLLYKFLRPDMVEECIESTERLQRLLGQD